MNFYKMDKLQTDSISDTNVKKFDIQRVVSDKLKTLLKARPKIVENTINHKAGTDPILKKSHQSNLVDDSRQLMNLNIPKPKLADTSFVPIIEDCVETYCVPVSNSRISSTPSQRIGSNYSLSCLNLILDFKKKKIIVNEA